MAFIIEDGVGRDNATSYISVQELKDVWETWGYPATQGDDEYRVLINKATRQIDAKYARYFTGDAKAPYQALEWPRTGSTYYNGTSVLPNAIPREIKDATAIMAYLIYTGVDMQPVANGENLAHYRVRVDEIEEEKTFAGSSLSNPKPKVSAVDDAMAKFTGGYSRRYDLKLLRVGG